MSTQLTPRDPECIPLSVVIATLGGYELETTIQLLLAATRLPEEIMICIPEGTQPKARIQEDSCVHIVWSPYRGQVAQRAYGLAQARNPFIMQMDDDVSMPEATLEQLFAACLKRGPGNAIAPIFRHCGTDEYLTRYQRSLRGFLQSLSASVIGGAPWGARRMGGIDQAGIPYAIDRNYCNGADFVETEWLPGGCVICRREDLVVENYYPFSGKAYSEDVIHSILWRQRGVRLWVASNISVCTYVAPMPVSMAAIRDDYRARAYLVSLTGGSLLRCRLWFALFVIRQWLSRLFVGRS